MKGSPEREANDQGSTAKEHQKNDCQEPSGRGFSLDFDVVLFLIHVRPARK